MIDNFDAILNAKCSIWKKGGSGVFDSYGHESQTFTLLKDNIACSVMPGSGKELQTEAAFGIQSYTVFMRPQKVDNPPVDLNIHHWLQINTTIGLDGTSADLVNPPATDGQQLINGLNITNISNPGLLNHHLEISASLVEP